MPNILPVSDLRNYNEVLKNCQVGEPVFLTKNGRGKFVVMDIEDYECEKAEKKMDAPFQKQLFDYIDCKKLNDVDVYKKANIDRRLFSKIRSNENYRPSKDTVIALCISMKLTLEESEVLLKSVGASLSNSILRDVIIKACIKYEIYNIDDVDLLLIERNLEPLSNY